MSADAVYRYGIGAADLPKVAKMAICDFAGPLRKLTSHGKRIAHFPLGSVSNILGPVGKRGQTSDPYPRESGQRQGAPPAKLTHYRGILCVSLAARPW